MKLITDINQLDTNKIYSYADYLLWRFSERVELIKGKIFRMSPAPTSQHQQIVSTLNFYFYKFVMGTGCKVFPAPFDVRFSRFSSESEKDVVSVVQPDITVVCDQGKLDEKGCNGAPDLIVEVVSKSSVSKDLHEKFELYESAGVREYWVVQPNDNTLTIFTLGENGSYLSSKPLTKGDIARSSYLKGFEIDLNELFQDMVSEPAEPYGPNVRRL